MNVRRQDGSEVTVTARGLFLDRHLRAQQSTEPGYDPDVGEHGLPRWDHDTCVGGLALDAELVDGWRARGARVLDLAAGLAVVATELAALGVDVDAADGEFDEGHPAFVGAAELVRARYVAEMEVLDRRRDEPRWRMDARHARLFDACFARREDIARAFPRGPARRVRADARDLATIEDASYDVVLSGWLLVHLEDAAQASALASMVRVTRPLGEIRVKSGHGGSSRRELARWFAGGEGDVFVAHGRRARIDARSSRDLLVLAVSG